MIAWIEGVNRCGRTKRSKHERWVRGLEARGKTQHRGPAISAKLLGLCIPIGDTCLRSRRRDPLQ